MGAGVGVSVGVGVCAGSGVAVGTGFSVAVGTGVGAGVWVGVGVGVAVGTGVGVAVGGAPPTEISMDANGFQPGFSDTVPFPLAHPWNTREILPSMGLLRKLFMPDATTSPQAVLYAKGLVGASHMKEFVCCILCAVTSTVSQTTMWSLSAVKYGPSGVGVRVGVCLGSGVWVGAGV